MKIAILTHPLEGNYGGILQAYALSTFLKRQGHEVVILRRFANNSNIKRIIKQFLISIKYPRYYSPRFKEQRRFKSKYLKESKILYSSHELSKFISKNKFDIVIVGSDQVWRADFAKSFGYDYFLEFVPSGVKKIAYAASFGLSTWDYSTEETKHIQRLLETFDAVSVREIGGEKLCMDYLNFRAEHVLDPTMLLQVTDYANLASPRVISDNYIFIYWLGSKETKKKILESITDIKIVDISLTQKDALPSIEDWLSYIKYADRVITDSFHGMVFSLLFHKNIEVFPNDKGGNDRILSLFKMFGIEDKLTQPQSGIDYDKFESTLSFERYKSILFLEKILI